MTVRLLQPDGDITTQGVQFTFGLDEVEQTIRTRLRLFLGEYFRDITDGTPWFEQILGKGVSVDARDAAIRNRVVNTPDVIRLTSYTSDFNINTREYSVTIGVLTSFGLLTVTENG